MKRLPSLALAFFLALPIGCGPKAKPSSALPPNRPPSEKDTRSDRAPAPESQPSSQPPQNAVAPVATIAVAGPWKIIYASKCSHLDDEKCAGYYGFTLAHDGSYEIGPGPKQEILRGTIGPDEVTSWRESVVKLLNSNSEDAGHAPVCASASTGDTETVSLIVGPKQRHWQVIAGNFCLDGHAPEGRTADALKSLHELWAQTLGRYYPETFPNPCIDAALDFAKSYPALRQCERDADCAYVGTDFLPQSLDRASELMTDDCTYIEPLLVANGFESVSKQGALLKQLELVKDTCGPALSRPHCDQPTRLQFRSAPPVCAGGTCQIPKEIQRSNG